MKGIVFIVFYWNISLLSVFRSESEVHKIKCRLAFPSQFQFATSVSRWKGFCILRNFQFFKGKTVLLLFMNLLKVPALAQKCSQFEISTYHGSQLMEHETCPKHEWYWRIPFCDEMATEMPQVLFGKTR